MINLHLRLSPHLELSLNISPANLYGLLSLLSVRWRVKIDHKQKLVTIRPLATPRRMMELSPSTIKIDRLAILNLSTNGSYGRMPQMLIGHKTIVHLPSKPISSIVTDLIAPNAACLVYVRKQHWIHTVQISTCTRK